MIVILLFGYNQLQVNASETYEDVSASWDFKNDLPSGIQSATSYEGVTADIQSTVSSISMHVDATSGKLYCVGRNNAQINAGTILQVPVKSTKDTVTIVGYGGGYSPTFTINGTTYSDDNFVYVAKTADVSKGYVEATVANGGYIYSVSVVQVSPYQEKPLYETDFMDWDEMKASTSETTITKQTKYSHETITFSLYNTAVNPAGSNAKFQNGETLGWLMASKAEDPYVITSTLASITKVYFVHGATGSKRGWKLEVKGDGDSDWVTLSDAVANPAGWSPVEVEVNRTNAQLRWTNLNSSQNAYMFQLKIYGMVDLSKVPAIASFDANGTTFTAADICVEDASGNMTATVELSKSASMISESNPLTNVVADNGEVGTITYTTTGSGADAQTVAVIPVSANGETVTYKITFVFKPDYTLTYINSDGSTVIGTQSVEKDATIGQFAYGQADVTIANGYAFRGWAESVEDKNQFKYTEGYVVTTDLSLYAMVTDIETANDTARYEYDLTSPYFFADDHEGFNLTGKGAYYNNHGWVIYDDDQISLLVGGTGYIKLGLCQYGGSCTITLLDPQGNTVGTASAPASSDGAETSIQLDGLASGTYTLSFSGGTYLHSITVVNTASTPFESDGTWYVVKSGDADALITTLELVNGFNSSSSSQRRFIFLPNGTYDLGNKCLTSISGYNISLVGQSTDGVTIKNLPTAEGIGVTATLLNTSNNLYMQDLTLQNAWDYNGATGRAVCLQDKGKKTICKNVKMLSYQDTYYSNGSGQFYWETSEIHGVVDYLCGGGTVYYNECKLVNEDVNGKAATMTAPYNTGDDLGYIFESCTVESPVSFNYGRAWGGNASLIYLNTTLLQPSNIASSRFTTAGMNVAAKKFMEYNTMDSSGNVVSPTSNVLDFTLNGSTVYSYETIMAASEATQYSYDNIFTSWDPKTLCVQVALGDSAVYDDAKNTISWNAVDGAIMYFIFKDDVYVGMTEETSYSLSETSSSSSNARKNAPATINDSTYTVRAANSMGGLGDAQYVKLADTDGIETINAEQDNDNAPVYNVLGQRVKSGTKGLVIKNGKKYIVK